MLSLSPSDVHHVHQSSLGDRICRAKLKPNTLMSALYPKQTTTVHLSDDTKAAITYKNAQNQARHLVLIEKIGVNQNGDLPSRSICKADGDLLI